VRSPPTHRPVSRQMQLQLHPLTTPRIRAPGNSPTSQILPRATPIATRALSPILIRQRERTARRSHQRNSHLRRHTKIRIRTNRQLNHLLLRSNRPPSSHRRQQRPKSLQRSQPKLPRSRLLRHRRRPRTKTKNQKKTTRSQQETLKKRKNTHRSSERFPIVEWTNRRSFFDELTARWSG
jgi:hypothetical protein